MRCLIIGGFTKIGINYMNYYVAKEDTDFVCLAEKDFNMKYFSVNPKINKNLILEINKINSQSVEEILSKYKIDKVINFYELENKEYTDEQYDNENYKFVVELYELCEKYNVKHITHISSIDVYGNNFNLFPNEQKKCVQSCGYTNSKIKSDEFLLKQTKVKTAILRISEVFGKVYSDLFLDNILNSLLKDLSVVINEDSDFIRSYIDIEDVNYIINSVTTNEYTGIFNVCSDFYINAKGIITLLSKMFSFKEENVIYTSRCEVKIPCVKADNTLIKRTLDYKIEMQEEKFNFFLSDIAYKKRIKEIDDSLII